MLSCILDDPLRVGLDAATIRSSYAKRGALATWEQFAIRAGRPLEWMEGRLRGLPQFPDELTLIVVHVGYATMTRPADEADRERAREMLAAGVLRMYLEELDKHEAAVEEAKAQLPAHLRGDRRERQAPPDDRYPPDHGDRPDAPPPARVAPIPAGGLRDLFTGEERPPIYNDEPPRDRPPQRRLL